ncbi:MAG: hypothetical protein QHH02_00320 [Syntrophomonadaceae bacterium]|nr:hypothetical protein [Syntrophomonadaceae bacterium]
MLDNNRIELSSRPDDHFYQLNNYAVLASAALGVRPSHWEGIYFPNWSGSDYPLKQIARAAADLNVMPIIITNPEPSRAGGNFTPFQQLIAETSFYVVPVQCLFEQKNLVPESLSGLLRSLTESRSIDNPLVAVQLNLDFSAEPPDLIERQRSFSSLLEELPGEPGIVLVNLKAYLDKLKAKGQLELQTYHPLPDYFRLSLRDLEERQFQLETQLLWSLRQRYPQAKDWIDLLGFGIADSNRRFEVIEELLARFYPQGRVRAYRLLNRLRNLAYLPAGVAREGYWPEPAVLTIAHRLVHALLALFNNRDPDQGIIEKRDWDGDGRDELVLNSRQQTLVVQPSSGKVLYCRFIHPDLPTGSAELTSWLEGLLVRNPSNPDFGKYPAAVLAGQGEWTSAKLFIRTEDGFSPLPRTSVQMIKTEESASEQQVLEVKVVRQEEYQTPAGELLTVELQQQYRIDGNALEVITRGFLVTPGSGLFLGISLPILKTDVKEYEKLSYQFPLPAPYYYQLTPLFPFDNQGLVRASFRVEYNP